MEIFYIWKRLLSSSRIARPSNIRRARMKMELMAMQTIESVIWCATPNKIKISGSSPNRASIRR